MSALDDIDVAFEHVEKPEHFCNYLRGFEDEEFDQLLRQRDRATIAIEDVGNPCWDPFTYASAEGLAYYIPALARLALSKPTYDYGWYGDQLLFRLTYLGSSNRFLNFCNANQRKAIAALLKEMLAFSADFNERLSNPEEMARAIDVWLTLPKASCEN